jgi:hypothetical protein
MCWNNVVPAVGISSVFEATFCFSFVQKKGRKLVDLKLRELMAEVRGGVGALLAAERVISVERYREVPESGWVRCLENEERKREEKGGREKEARRGRPEARNTRR